MSVEDNGQDSHVRALRAAGEDRAADILEALAGGDQQQRQEQESQPKVGPPGIPMLSDHVGFDHQAQAEARTVAEALRRSGVNQWMSAGPLLGGPDAGGR